MNLIRFAIGVCTAIMLCACGQKADQARTYVERGKGLVEAEQYDKAISLFTKAIEINPQYPDAYLQLALLYDDFLNDTTNAIPAYERFIAVAPDTEAKKQAERWLASARDRGIAPPEDSELSSSPPNLQEELRRKERQFDILRQQTAARFEAEIDALKAQLEAVRTNAAVLERENTALRSVSGAVEHISLRATVASNEQVLARLTTALTIKQKEAATAVSACEALRSQTTNLQHQLDQVARLAAAQTNKPVVAVQTNKTVVAANEDMARHVLALERERNDLRSNCFRLQQLLVHATSAAPVVASAGSAPAIMPHALTPAEGGTRTGTRPTVTRAATWTNTVTSAGTPRVATVAAPPPSRTYPDVPVTAVPSAHVARVGGTTGIGRTYVVQSGDSLMKIARAVYGDQNKWMVLYEGNRDTMNRPNQLRVGQIIRVPALTR